MEDLEKLVKVMGDGCVTGYVRFKKIKEVKGYDDAGKRAAKHLSKIKAGRPMDNGRYAAVVRFRLILLIIPFVALGLWAAFFWNRTNARVKEPVKREYETEIIQIAETDAPDNTDNNEYSNLYITVPGYTHCTVSSSNTALAVKNPAGNECMMQYVIYVGNNVIGESDLLSPGETGRVEIYWELTTGEYDGVLVTLSYSMDGKTQFNSVNQDLLIKVN